MTSSVPAWTRHRDDTYNTDYWYNAKTGESSWTEPVGAGAGAEAGAGAAGAGAADVDLESEAWETDSLLTSDSSAIAAHSSHRAGKASSSTGSGASEGGVRSSDIEKVSLLLHVDRVYADTAGDVGAYERSMLYTAFFIESPLCVLEGTLRAGSFLAAAVLWGIMAVGAVCFTAAGETRRDTVTTSAGKGARGVTRSGTEGSSSSSAAVKARRHRRYLIYMIACLKEAALCLAATLTLLIPFTACLVYRYQPSASNMTPSTTGNRGEEWDLAPLPTVLGWVDSRRFMTFVFGGGRFAVLPAGGNDGSSGSGEGEEAEAEGEEGQAEEHGLSIDDDGTTATATAPPPTLAAGAGAGVGAGMRSLVHVEKVISQIESRYSDVHLLQEHCRDSFGRSLHGDAGSGSSSTDRSSSGSSGGSGSGSSTSSNGRSKLNKLKLAILKFIKDHCECNRPLCVGVPVDQQVPTSAGVGVAIYSIGISYGILCYPRKMHRRIQEILRGRSERQLSAAIAAQVKVLEATKIEQFHSAQIGLQQQQQQQQQQLQSNKKSNKRGPYNHL